MSSEGCFIFMRDSVGLSHAFCVLLPGLQFLEPMIVSLCWASGMAIVKLSVRVFKNIFRLRECEISSTEIFNPLKLLFIPVWVSAASYKMRNNTDPQTLRREQLSNFNPERTHIHVSSIRSMLYHFQGLMKLPWILPWPLGSSGFAPGLWDYGDLALKR